MRTTSENEKHLKILFVADAGNIHTQRWVKYFSDNGHEVHLVTQRPPGNSNMVSVNLHMLRKTHCRIKFVSYMLCLIFNVIQIRKSIKELKPDIIHAHFVTNYGFWAALSCFHPFVLTAWGSDISVGPKQSKILRWILVFALRKADLVTCDGENVRDELIKLGVAKKRLHLILHGVDTQKFCKLPKNEKLTQELGISDSPVVMSIRSLYTIYDVETLIKSIPLVLKQISGVKFLIAGEGEQKNYLKALVCSLNIAQSVRFVGQILHDELPQYLALADIYVSTSLSEGGVSISLLEAMACSLPPIVTEVGDIKKWISDGKNGFIIPVKDPKLLSERIVYLLKDKEARQKFGEINRRIVQDKSDYFKEMEKIENLLVKLENTFV